MHRQRGLTYELGCECKFKDEDNDHSENDLEESTKNTPCLLYRCFINDAVAARNLFAVDA